MKGNTIRRNFVSNEFTSFCIALMRMSSTCNWVDFEVVFAVPSPALREMFRETIETCDAEKGNLFTNLNSKAMRERAPLYAECVREKGVTMKLFVGFMDCTKLRTERPGKINALQRAGGPCKKSLYCLIYESGTTRIKYCFPCMGWRL